MEALKSAKFKFLVSGKKNVFLFGVMTKTSILSEKAVPLHTGCGQVVDYSVFHCQIFCTKSQRTFYPGVLCFLSLHVSTKNLDIFVFVYVSNFEICYIYVVYFRFP